MTDMQRCPWCTADELYIKYHDEEWGVPAKDDPKIFEFIVLEGAQAGLSWFTVLKRRENYRAAFASFDAEKVAAFGEDDVTRLMNNSGIIRNKLKIESAIKNARAFLETAERFGTFYNYLWSFVDYKPIINHWENISEIPAVTPLAKEISKDMKKRGFSFFGPTICYAHMQGTGMVNDHLTSCFRHKACIS